MNLLLKSLFKLLMIIVCVFFVRIFDAKSQVLTLPLDQRPEWLKREGLIMAGSWEPLTYRIRQGTSDGHEPTPEELAAWEYEHSPEVTEKLKELGVNFIMMHCYKGAGLNVEKKTMNDAVRFASQYHDAGLHVGVYVYSGAFLWEPMYREVPESQNWILLDRNKKPLDYYNMGIRYFWNRNNPDAQAFYKKVIDFAVNKIQADMLHFDNFSQGPSCDAYSIDRFRDYLRNTFSLQQLEQMGAADLSKVVPPMSAWTEKTTYHVEPMDRPAMNMLDFAWLKFSGQSLTNAYFDMGRYARSLNKEILLELNAGGAGDRIYWKDYGQLLGGGEAHWSEGKASGYYDGIFHTRIQSYKVAKAMNNLVFFYAGTPLSMAESMAFNTDCLGMICNFTDGKIQKQFTNDSVFNDVKPYIDFYRSRRSLFRKAEVIADVAVLRSYPSQVFADPENANLTSSVEQYCIDKRIPFQIIFDNQLETLQKYRTLVLAGCVALSDMQIEHITSFVDQGGNLCIIGPVAEYDGWMVPRRDHPFSNIPKEQIVRINKDGNTGEALLQSVGGRFSVNVDSPEGIYAEYTVTNEGHLVHLVNFKPESPVMNVQLSMHLPEGKKPGSILLASPDRNKDLPVKFRIKDGNILFTVPEIRLYEIAIVKI